MACVSCAVCRIRRVRSLVNLYRKYIEDIYFLNPVVLFMRACGNIKMTKKVRVQRGTAIQLTSSLVGGACFTIGIWFIMSTSVVSRFPVKWVYGAMLFVLSAATSLTSMTILSIDPRNMAVKIYVLCMGIAVLAYSIGIMFLHPLNISPLPCPVGTYGAPDQTTCLPCQCVNGDCDSGRAGTGQCFCYGRWAGEFCDACAPHVISVAPNNGDASCDLCEVGWNYATNCTTCYPGYAGDNCDSCATNYKRFNYNPIGREFEAILAEGGLNPWLEPRQHMVAMQDSENPNDVVEDGLRCDGCVGDLNTRFCVKPECNQMDDNAFIKLNEMPPAITLSDTICYDDYECEFSWLCVKMNPLSPSGFCSSLSRESFGCECGSVGAVEPLCLFCDQIGISSCGEGTCTWAPREGGTPLQGQVECMCKENWNRYPKDLTDRVELVPGSTNLLNASCTLFQLEDEKSCMDTTFGKHCLPCTCGNRGVCDDGIEGSGNCTCVLDSAFGGLGMWQGVKCDQCFEECSLNLKDETEGCVPKCDGPSGYEEGGLYCLGVEYGIPEQPCVWRSNDT